MTAGAGRADAATTRLQAPDGSGAGRRNAALDGLRGAAVLLVALGHAGDQLWPRSAVDGIPLLRGFFGGGAVGVFFVVGGLVVMQTLLREHAAGTLDPVRFYVRRLVRIGVQLLPLALVVLVVHRIDASDPYTDAATTATLAHTLAYTVNVWAPDHLLEVRADLGHLWYLGVQQQVYVVLPLVVAVLARSRRGLAAVLVAAAALVTWNRERVLDTDGWLVATISTPTRADGLFLGALVAVLLPVLAARANLRRLSPGRLAGVAALGLVGLVLVLQELPDLAFLHAWGTAFLVLTAVLTAGLVLADGPTRTARVLAARPLAYLGRASLAIFIWHLPVFAFVARHTPDWQWWTRTLVAVAVLAAVVGASHRYVEEPTRRWLATHLRAPRPTGSPSAAPERSAVAPPAVPS